MVIAQVSVKNKPKNFPNIISTEVTGLENIKYMVFFSNSFERREELNNMVSMIPKTYTPPSPRERKTWDSSPREAVLMKKRITAKITAKNPIV